jgi:hypothetical protein
MTGRRRCHTHHSSWDLVDKRSTAISPRGGKVSSQIAKAADGEKDLLEICFRFAWCWRWKVSSP